MTENNSKETKVGFSDKSREIIDDILKKHELDGQQKEGLSKFFQAEPEERQKILNELPGSKIVLLLLAYQEGSIRLSDFAKILEKNLNISIEKAEEISQELKEKVIVFESEEKPAPEEPAPEEEAPHAEELSPEEKYLTEETPIEKEIPTEEEPSRSDPDVYREPIE